MPRTIRLKKAMAAIGLSLISLSGTFNSNAQTAESPAVTPQGSPTIVIPMLSAQRQQDIRLYSAMTGLNLHIGMMSRRGPGYEPGADPVVQRKIQDVIEALNNGANPNSIIGNGLNFNGGTGLTPFHAAIILAQAIRSSDIVTTFLTKGGDVRMRTPDGWSAMDIAVSGALSAQSETRKDFDTALNILGVLTQAGGRLSDATALAEVRKIRVENYADLAGNPVAARILLQKNLITQDQFRALDQKRIALEEKVRRTPSLTAEWIKANGGVLNDYPDAPPAGPEPYRTLSGDTLRSVAERFKSVMGFADTEQALQALARTSGVRPDAVIAEGTRLLVPMPVGRQLGVIKVNNAKSLMDIARTLTSSHYDRNATAEDIARELATMNALDPRRIDEAGLITKGQVLHTAYKADIHLQFRPLTPPAHYRGGREVDLVVIEAKDEDGSNQHGKDTYRVSSNIAFSINPGVDQSQIHSMAEMLLNYPDKDNSDALDMLMNSAGSPINDRVVFSHSMGFFAKPPFAVNMRQSRDEDGSMLYEMIREYTDQMERSRPIIFAASGNWNPEEMRHVQSHPLSHSPRTIHIGAAGKYKNQNVLTMSSYSSYGADVCAPLPSHIGSQMEGTSFATPLAAALYRQFSEWYGDTLSFEEIMAAGLMSADRNVHDIANPEEIGTMPPGQLSSKPAVFNTNGAGLPNHERCGAGVLNPEKWQTTLNRMMTIKQSLTTRSQEAHYDITVGAPLVIPDSNGGKTQYVYRMSVPQDMTLGKLTFRMPQAKGKHSEVVVRTPAGFEKHLGYTYTDIMSTFAFAYEDVRAGQVIEIRTTEPLGPTSGMILRGHTPGNAIAVLRDHLRSQGVLPAPLQAMEGDVITGPSAPVAGKALKDFVPFAPQKPITIINPHMPTPPSPAPQEPQQPRQPQNPAP